jgi:hypothetical protein
METVKEILERLKTCKDAVMWIGDKTIHEDDGISEIHITDNLRSDWNEKVGDPQKSQTK